MDAVKFIEERDRMCKSFGVSCQGCPAFGAGEDVLCCAVEKESPLDATSRIAIVEEWSITHPRKTRQSELLKIFPDAVIDANTGAVLICPATISNSYRDEEGICKQIGVYCCDCQSRFWFEEIE